MYKKKTFSDSIRLTFDIFESRVPRWSICRSWWVMVKTSFSRYDYTNNEHHVQLRAYIQLSRAWHGSEETPWDIPTTHYDATRHAPAWRCLTSSPAIRAGRAGHRRELLRHDATLTSESLVGRSEGTLWDIPTTQYDATRHAPRGQALTGVIACSRTGIAGHWRDLLRHDVTLTSELRVWRRVSDSSLAEK